MLSSMPRTLRGIRVLVSSAEGLAAFQTTAFAEQASKRKGASAGLRAVGLQLPDAMGKAPTKRRDSGWLNLQPGVTDLRDGSYVNLSNSTFTASEADEIMQALQAEVPWMEQEIVVFGQRVKQPRLTAYTADDASLAYTYSKTKQYPLPWIPVVSQVKEAVEALAGVSFNSCLLNYYRDGNDSLSWHSDNERLYGKNPTVGSASFGACREFQLRNMADKSVKHRAQLGEGSLLIMSGTLQHCWMHRVPKAKGCQQPRINLTFRQIRHKECD